MEKELTDICAYLNNYFWRTKRNVKINIVGGTFTVDFLKQGQYFRIVNSDFNDGVWKYPATGMTDEEFTGSIWSMAVPAAVIDLAVNIKAWRDKYEAPLSDNMSPFSSESFGNYSYGKGSASASGGTTNPNSWQSVFSAQLAPYRRLRNMP